MHGGCSGHFRLFLPCYFYVFFAEEGLCDLKNEPVQGCLLSCLPTYSPCGNRFPPAGHVPQLPLPWGSRAREVPSTPLPNPVLTSLQQEGKSPPPSQLLRKRALQLFPGAEVSLLRIEARSSLGWQSLLPLSCLTCCRVDPDRSNIVSTYRGHQHTFYVCHESQFSVAFFCLDIDWGRICLL